MIMFQNTSSHGCHGSHSFLKLLDRLMVDEFELLRRQETPPSRWHRWTKALKQWQVGRLEGTRCLEVLLIANMYCLFLSGIYNIYIYINNYKQLIANMLIYINGVIRMWLWTWKPKRGRVPFSSRPRTKVPSGHPVLSHSVFGHGSSAVRPRRSAKR